MGCHIVRLGMPVLAALAAAGGGRAAAGAPAGPDFRVDCAQQAVRPALQNTAGRTVLAEVPAAGMTGASVADPALPLGADPGSLPRRYGPLTFTVGTAAASAYPGTFWEGNLLAATAGGVTYKATGVQARSRSGSRLALTLSTDDPTGRTLAVSLTTSGGLLRVDVTPSSMVGVVSMGDAFLSALTERFAGFGGLHTGLEQHGASFPSYAQEENFDAANMQPVTDQISGRGGQRYQFPNGPGAA